ncbi:MAG TPA: response regulator transcription factor [Stenotrophomonas sp.]|jgi:two-component system capsular synthesis response regulator RcsB
MPRALCALSAVLAENIRIGIAVRIKSSRRLSWGALAFARPPTRIAPLSVIKLIVADDHPLVRAGISYALRTDPGIRLIAQADSTDALFKILHSRRCDVALVDLNMPGGTFIDGVPMLNSLHRRWPHMPVLAFTLEDNLGVLQLVVSAGVRGVVLKSEPMSELSAAVRCVHAGGTYFSDAIHRKWANRERHAHTVPRTPLSPREHEVFCAFVRGSSVSEIADQLGLSIKTVSRQKRSAMAKLRLTGDVEAFAYAHALGLLD